MFFRALATDYDGTLAQDGRVDDATVEALREFKDTGRKLILVTGRRLPDLGRVFDRVALFDRAVAENGAVLNDPATGKTINLAPPPPQRFIELLKKKGVAPLAVGHVVVATTWEPNEKKVFDAIRELGIEHQVIFNKGAVMVLPPGVNKASGLMRALDDLGIPPRRVVAVGDAENDHALLQCCGCGVAVANALPSLKVEAEIVTSAPRGAGVIELIQRIIAEDGRLAVAPPQVAPATE